MLKLLCTTTVLQDVSKDHVFIDLSSQKLIVSSHVTEASQYNTMLPGSSKSSNTTWSGECAMNMRRSHR